MGIDTYIVGFKPPDKKYDEMLRVYEACTRADVSIPKEVGGFFNYEYPPDPAGVKVSLYDHESVIVFSDGEGAEGLEVDLRKLPSDIKIIRFINSI